MHTYKINADTSGPKNGTVETLSASCTRQSVSVNGVFADDGAIVYAVVIKVCDKSGKTLAMESAAVYDKSFSLTISDLEFSADTAYDVCAADYVGGNWKKTEIKTSGIAAAPTGFVGVQPTVFGANDGKIIGTTNAMEYCLASDSTVWTACTGTETDNLSAGTYYVRIKETDDSFASAYATVTVPDGDKLFDIIVTSYNAEYDGQAHGISLSGVPEGATIKYGTAEGTYELDSLSFTDCTDGEKKVYFKVTMEGYKAYEGYGTVTITSPEPTDPEPPVIIISPSNIAENADAAGSENYPSETVNEEASVSAEQEINETDSDDIGKIESVDSEGNKVTSSSKVEEDGSVVTSEIIEKTDGTVVETITSTGKNTADKNMVSRRVVEKDENGSILSDEETISIPKAASNTSTEVNITKNADGVITESKAVVRRTVPAGSTGLKLPGIVLDQIDDIMDGKKVWITFIATDEDGNVLYKLKVSSKAIAMDVPLYLEKYDKKSKAYVRFSQKSVKPGETGNYHATGLTSGTFRLVTKKSFDKAAN